MFEKFDVFISFKNLDEKGNYTEDSHLAKKVYDYLSQRGVKVFFSNVTLEQLGASQYQSIIDKALDQSNVLVAVGTNCKNLESKWVAYEWSSFFNDILSGKHYNRLFTYVSKMTIKDLPRILRNNQVFLDEENSLETLYNHIVNGLNTMAKHTDATSLIETTKLQVHSHLKGEIDGKSVKILVNKNSFLIGRSEEKVDFVIQNKNISRIHAAIHKKDGKFFITDCESANGTYINQSRITHTDLHEIKDKDIIRLANIEFTFEDKC